MLLVDEGPSAELDAQIAIYEAIDLEKYPPGRELAAWARERSAGATTRS